MPAVAPSVLPNSLNDIVQIGGIGAILFFFLKHFMAELKSVRKQMDDREAAYQANMTSFLERLARMEERSQDVIRDNSESYAELSNAVNKLSEAINKTTNESIR